MSRLSSKMQSSLSVDGMSRWAWSSFSRIKEADTTDCVQHVVLEMHFANPQ